MSEKEKQTAQSIAEAMNRLPEAKREFLIGFAEGVAAMSETKREEAATGIGWAMEREGEKHD